MRNEKRPSPVTRQGLIVQDHNLATGLWQSDLRHPVL